METGLFSGIGRYSGSIELLKDEIEKLDNHLSLSDTNEVVLNYIIEYLKEINEFKLQAFKYTDTVWEGLTNDFSCESTLRDFVSDYEIAECWGMYNNLDDEDCSRVIGLLECKDGNYPLSTEYISFSKCVIWISYDLRHDSDLNVLMFIGKLDNKLDDSLCTEDERREEDYYDVGAMLNEEYGWDIEG